MSLRSRIEAWLLPRMFPNSVEEMGRVVGILEDAYERGGLLMPPDQVLRHLQENGQLTDLLIRLRGSVFAAGFNFTESDRKAAIDWHEFAYATNVNIESAVHMWTDFGMGQQVSITSAQPQAAAVLDEFWTAKRNKPILGIRQQQQISINALNEGELAFAFWYSPLDGVATIREVSTKELEIVWLDKSTKLTPLFYIMKDEKSGDLLYVPDWLADPDDLDAVEIPHGARRADQDATGDKLVINGREVDKSQAVMLWAARNKINGRGTPQFKNGLEWAKVLQQFMGDRAAVARKAAMYVDNVTVQGGSRAVNAVVQNLQSSLATSANTAFDTNPPTVAGSDWVQNEAITREWQTRDTGATAARFDGRMLAGQLSVNTGIPLHWMGFPDALANRSTAEESKIPWLEQIKRYKSWLSSVFEDLGRVVLKLVNDNTAASVDWEKVEIMVTMETPLNVLLEELQLVMAQLTTAVEKEVLPVEIGTNVAKELFSLALQKIGSAQPEALLERATLASYGRLIKTVVANYDNGAIDQQAAVGFLLEELRVVSNGYA